MGDSIKITPSGKVSLSIETTSGLLLNAINKRLLQEMDIVKLLLLTELKDKIVKALGKKRVTVKMSEVFVLFEQYTLRYLDHHSMAYVQAMYSEQVADMRRNIDMTFINN